MNRRCVSTLVALGTLGATLAASIWLQTNQPRFGMFAHGLLLTAYIAVAFAIARRTGWRLWLVIAGGLSYPLWAYTLAILFSMVGIMLGLHDGALPGETARQAYQETMRSVLGWIVAGLLYGAWLVLLPMCTQSLRVGIGTVTLAVAMALLRDSPHAGAIFHGSLCAMLMCWAVYNRAGGDEKR